MKDTHEHILKTHIPKHETRTHTIRADTSDSRGWLKDAPVCSILAAYNSVYRVCFQRLRVRITRPKSSGPPKGRHIRLGRSWDHRPCVG